MIMLWGSSNSLLIIALSNTEPNQPLLHYRNSKLGQDKECLVTRILIPLQLKLPTLNLKKVELNNDTADSNMT